MNYLVFRNSTVEQLFSKIPDKSNFSYSDYGSLEFEPKNFDVFIWFYNLPISDDINSLVNEINDYENRIKLIFNKIPDDKPFLIFSIENIGNINFVQSNWKLKDSIYKINHKIFEFSLKYQNVKIVDLSNFLSKFSEKDLIDWRYYYLSKSILNPKLSYDFSNWFHNQLSAINQKRKKCLILDLDNTLWGGIIGEDGISGIKLGDNYPGNAFKEFQIGISELKKLGVILAICSKNNLNDIIELWEKHDQMILKREDFASIKINWKNKAENITEIASELNIGMDSFVFIDDNPTERELIKKLLPKVKVPEFPEKPYMLKEFLREIYLTYFQTYKLTLEDSYKTQQYIDNQKRDILKKDFISLDGYLKELEISLSLIPMSEVNQSRFSQMTQKTNQFNLTTKRYTEVDLIKMGKNNDLLIGLKVEDKFGDMGISGLMIIKIIEDEVCEIDSLLLSCRILGKGIETAFLYTMLKYLKLKNISKVYANYNESSKNEQVKWFYENHNFIKLNEEKSNKYYVLDLNNVEELKIQDYYKINMTL